MISEESITEDVSLQVWMRLPRVEVNWKLEPSREGSNKEWILHVQLFRRVLKRVSNARAYVPHFPKVSLQLLELHVYRLSWKGTFNYSNLIVLFPIFTIIDYDICSIVCNIFSLA